MEEEKETASAAAPPSSSRSEAASLADASRLAPASSTRSAASLRADAFTGRACIVVDLELTPCHPLRLRQPCVLGTLYFAMGGLASSLRPPIAYRSQKQIP